MNVGARVRFKAHGETGLPYVVIERTGDDVTLKDPRGRILPRTPIELLESAEPGGDKPWREVDELEAR